MSQLAVRAAVLAQAATASLEGTVWAQQGGQLQQFRQRPKEAKLGASPAVIGGRMHYQGVRSTVPRGFGQRQRHYEVEVLVYATAVDEARGGDDFDTLLERIAEALVATAVPIAAVDPTGNAPNSTLLSVAESIRVETLDPITTGGGQSRVRFYGIVTPAVTELTTG